MAILSNILLSRLIPYVEEVIGDHQCGFQVPEHTQLCWILGCLTTMPRLAHIPTYKEKSAMVKEVPLGLYVYPVLQAADVLLYR